ncbi:unnamed protein product [Tilletia laevis]|uniref:Uncharacterized protein n=4 Tax=Tilletia TaxID=13289 RepID=A0A177VAH7_9BASI|nr:hypothetical protein CF336_g2745 [Tilletia laevis]KAE8262599.1 hypothetical protein A4X03_0g2333 [Tilletia caries]KAE8203007.1 hypothetical protein CF335_g3195 [Tilletia laevis]CAD6890584.1 unnamed protein product [Tilletia caries]CAD6903379.1 unnamed protein product [Tilletia laevis]
MAQASALVRQSHAVLGGLAAAATTPTWRAAAKKVLEQDIGSLAGLPTSAASTSSFSHQASSSMPSSSSGTATDAQRESKGSIPPSFFQSTSPFVYSMRSSGDGPAVPTIEPFSLRSQVALREALMDALADNTSGARFRKTWEAYVALQRAPTTDGTDPGTTVVNLLPYIGIEVHRSVLLRIVPKQQSQVAYERAKERLEDALAEEVPVVGYRISAQRPSRKKHLHPIKISPSFEELVDRAPFVLDQMRLASVVQRQRLTAAASEQEAEACFAPTTADYNIVLSMLAGLGHVVPLSKVWCDMREAANERPGQGPDTKSYAIVVRGLYTHLQHQLNTARKDHAVTKARIEKSLEKASFVRRAEYEERREQLNPTEDSDLPRQKARREEQVSGNASPVANATNLAVIRLRTILKNLDTTPLRHSGTEQAGQSWYRTQLVDYALRILRLAGDVQGMAVLIRQEFGLRLGHPDVVEVAGSQRSGAQLTIHTLNTVLMALGEHATARDMVVAYESLARPLPSDLNADAEGESGSVRKGKWQSMADDEEDGGLLGLGSSETSQVPEGSGEGGSRLFKFDWSASNFRQDSTTSDSASVSPKPDAASVETHSSATTGYAIHPTTTTLRTLLRHLCTKTRPVSQSYAKLSRTLLPRGDWSVRSLRAEPTETELRRLITELHEEDDRRQFGQYTLLALAYAREGVEAYKASIDRMRSALEAQKSDKESIQIFEPPPLAPTAACFVPLIYMLMQRRNATPLRLLKQIMADSVEAMRQEQEVLSRANEHWGALFDEIRRKDIKLTEAASSTSEPLTAEEQHVRRRRRVLKEVVEAIERQKALVDQELEKLLPLVYGSTSTATGSEAKTEKDRSADVVGVETNLNAATLRAGGIVALVKAVGKRRRERKVKRHAQVVPEYRSEQKAKELEQARRREWLEVRRARKRSEARMARKLWKKTKATTGSSPDDPADPSVEGQVNEHRTA